MTWLSQIGATTAYFPGIAIPLMLLVVVLVIARPARSLAAAAEAWVRS